MKMKKLERRRRVLEKCKETYALFSSPKGRLFLQREEVSLKKRFTPLKKVQKCFICQKVKRLEMHPLNPLAKKVEVKWLCHSCHLYIHKSLKDFFKKIEL